MPAQTEARLRYVEHLPDARGRALQLSIDARGSTLIVGRVHLDRERVERLVATAITWLDNKSNDHSHSPVPDHAERSDAQPSEDAVDHLTDRDGRPLGCDVCVHARSRFDRANGGATTCSELDDRIVAVGRNKPNFRPVACPFNAASHAAQSDTRSPNGTCHSKETA